AMMLAHKLDDKTLANIRQIRQDRAASLAEFRRLADSPKSIQHGIDMESMSSEFATNEERGFAAMRAGKLADANACFHAAIAVSDALEGKAREAALWQEQRLTQVVQERDETSNMVF